MESFQGTGFKQIESMWLPPLYHNSGTPVVKTYATEINSHPTDV